MQASHPDAVPRFDPQNGEPGDCFRTRDAHALEVCHDVEQLFSAVAGLCSSQATHAATLSAQAKRVSMSFFTEVTILL